MPKKRSKNGPGRAPARKPVLEDAMDKSTTIFFYLTQEKPHGIFSQWQSSTIKLPTTSFSFLTDTDTDSPGYLGDQDSPTAILASYAPTITFNCAEQLYMFAKALYFADAQSCRRILLTPDPKGQKQWGRQVLNYDEEKWTEVKSRVAELGNWYKFTQHQEMRDVLLGTGTRELAEASTTDRIWGIGFRAKVAEHRRPEWGENRLGKALMRVRARIREVQQEEQEGKRIAWEWDGDG